MPIQVERGAMSLGTCLHRHNDVRNLSKLRDFQHVLCGIEQFDIPNGKNQLFSESTEQWRPKNCCKGVD